MAHPFRFSSIGARVPLVNLSSGLVAGSETETSLLHSVTMGRSLQNTLVEERLNTYKVNFFSTLCKLKIKTMAPSKQTKMIKLSETRNPENTSGQEFLTKLAEVSETCKVDLSDVITYELSEYPISLAHEDGRMRKTQKSILLTELTNVGTVVPKLPYCRQPVL